MSPGGTEFYGSRWKVSRVHKKLTEVDGRSPGYTENLGKLTEGLTRVDRILRVSQRQRKLTEFVQKVTRQHKMLTEVDRMSLGRTES